MPSVFDRCFAVVVGLEAGFTRNAADPGNWTGGRCGIGECRGTNWGISAAAYSELNIAALTLAQAKEIYARDYWQKIHGDELPADLALLVFDAAVNNGPGQAARWLQAVVRVPPDGSIGPQTLNAVHAALARDGIGSVSAEFMALRLWTMSRLPSWGTFGRGWSRRLCQLIFAAGVKDT